MVKLPSPKHISLKQVQALNAVSRAIACVNHNDVLFTILQAIRPAAPVDAVGIYVLSQDRQAVERFSLISGHRRVVPGSGQTLRVRDSVLAKLALENTPPLICNDILSHPLASKPDAQIAAQAGVRSAVAIPLRQASQVYGTIVFDNYTTQQFTSDMLPFLQQVADYIAVFLGNQRLLQQIQLAARQDAIYEERRRLSRELHDKLAQSLTDMVLQLDLILEDIPSSSEFGKSLLQVRGQARNALADARNSVWQLWAGPQTGVPLPQALEAQLAELGQTTDVSTHCSVFGKPRDLSPHFALPICRIVQEALDNVRKHAQARQVRMHLNWQVNCVTIAIKDDGIGFDSVAVPLDAQGGFGLQCMHDQARLIGGKLDVGSQPGWGTCVTLTVPVGYSSLQPEIALLDIVRTQSNTRVLLVDDHEMVRQGLAQLLNRAPDVEVVGEASSGEECLQLAAQLCPDVILLDMQMPGQSGLEVLRALREQPSGPQVIVLSAYAQDGYVYDALRLGARGYLSKDAGFHNLLDAVRRVANGEWLLEPAMTSRLLEGMQGGTLEPLTGREREVLGLVAEGLRNREIALRLVVEESTVRWHVHNILGKLGANNRTEAVRVACERGLLVR
ncbi:MAG: response regulator [Chloroflexota bacterium]|nr:response regulator [Chloroflexota bacterium]